jgi:superfamily I DNA/RNA helicase/RecB family exonuclease
MRVPVLLDRDGALPGYPTPGSLDEAQQRVVAWEGPGTCVVLGSPGTGGTTAIMHAAAARLASVAASEVLVIGRDRGSVRRLRAGIAAMASGGALPTVTTFHGLAYALVRRSIQEDPDGVLPRLLSGAEEDVRIRDLLLGAIGDGALSWPDELRAAPSTLGFANDLRALLARARELGVSPEGMDSIGQRANVPAWASLGGFAQIEDDVMALEGVVDYTRLLDLAMDAVSAWKGVLRYIYVDEFHEAGLLQRRLLQSLATAGTATVVCADPDVSAFSFRGADRRGALELLSTRGAELIVLGRVHGGGGAIRRAYEAVRRQPGMPGIPVSLLHAYRHPREDPDAPPTSVDVISHDSRSDMAAWVADDLRRRHLGLDGHSTAWDSMAIIGRSSADLEPLRRSLESVAVPVRVDAADIPLQRESAVSTILQGVAAALDPDTLDARSAVDLLTGPLVGLDPSDIRALARALRDRQRALHPDAPAPSGTQLICNELTAAITERPTHPLPSPSSAPRADLALARLISVAELLRAVRRQAEIGAPPADVLWTIWAGGLSDDEGLAWPERLRRAALSGHTSSSHDVDAVMALFATAERLSDRYSGVVGIRGLLATLQDQRVPAEKVTHHVSSSPAVSLLTAHRAVGSSWDHVVIVGAQEGAWPPLVGGSSVLRRFEWESLARGEAHIGAATLLRDAAAERLSQERSLFALAVSRARRSLVVATVASEGDDEPSRFVEDLGVPSRHRPGRPARPLTMDGLVAALRTSALDPGASDGLRESAAQRLAALADAVSDDGAHLAPRADPSRWWGLDEVTPGAAPVRPSDQPIALSGSGLSSLRGCPARWFLSRIVHAEAAPGRAMAIGSIVHALAELVARDHLPPDPEVLLTEVDRVWSELAFDAPWESEAERAELSVALDRLCAYLRDSRRQVVAVEHEFSVTVPLRSRSSEGDDDEVVLRGYIDRVEADDEGRIHLIDFKTGRRAPSGPAVQADPQLGLYQEAVRHGALDGLHLGDTPMEGAECAGAALVQLRSHPQGAPGLPKIQVQPSLNGQTWLDDEISAAVARIRAEDFPAIPSTECRTCTFTASCPAERPEVGA